MVGGGVGGGEKRRPCGKRRDLHQAPFSSLEAFATPSTPAVLHPQPPLLPRPALLGWGPLSPVPAAPPHPEGKGRGPRETSGRSRPTRAPTRAPAAPALSRGHSGPLPAAPRAQPRPAAQGRRPRRRGAVTRGRLLARRGLQRKGRGVWTGGGDGRRRRGPGRPRPGRGRSGSAAISRGCRRQTSGGPLGSGSRCGGGGVARAGGSRCGGGVPRTHAPLLQSESPVLARLRLTENRT